MTRNCRCAMIPMPGGPVETVDTTAIEHLDADWAIPCEAKTYIPQSCKAQNRAEYIVRLIACCPATIGRAPLWCTACLELWKAQSFCGCNHCGRVFRPASASIREVEPLNGRPQ